MENKNQKVYILCGLIGSGKSTWAKNRVKEDSTLVILCRDNIREMLKGHYTYDTDMEVIVKSVIKFSLRKALQHGYSVIIDETNINKTSRGVWLNCVEEYNDWFDDGVALEIVYFTYMDDNVQRRMEDDPRGYSKDKWLEVYDGMFDSFEEPQEKDLPKNCTLTVVD